MLFFGLAKMPELPFPPPGDPYEASDDEEALARWEMEEYVAEQRLEALQAASHMAMRELRKSLPAEPSTGFADDQPDLSGFFEEADGLPL
ncbi:hypothetical protein EDM76_03595 [bacterium]|nr:MAG: hypothetical protein EDM76_03595 [bacterium]